MPRSRATRAATSATSSPSSTRRSAPSTAASAPQALESLALLRGRFELGIADDEDVEIAAEALRGAPGAAHHRLRDGLQRYQRQEALRDRWRGGAEEPLLAGVEGLSDQALRLDLLGDLAQGHLAKGLQVLDLEEAPSRASCTLRPG